MKPNLMMALSGLLLIFPVVCVQADGMSGLLDITGSLHHSPCVLDMTSAYQSVELGSIPRSQLQRPGDQAPPWLFSCAFRTAGVHQAACRMSEPARWSGVLINLSSRFRL